MKRYNSQPCGPGCCEPHEEDSLGDWVKVTDYLADRAQLLALLEEARALMNEAPQPGFAEAGRVYIQQWHERRRAWMVRSKMLDTSDDT